MTVEDWKYIESKLTDFLGGRVKLKIDGYDISLVLLRESKNSLKNVIAVYVNGYIKTEYLNENSEVAKRFMCPSKKCIFTKKEIEKITKNKKQQQLIKEKNTRIYYSPYWTSFRRLKSHFIKNNCDIELIQKENVF